MINAHQLHACFTCYSVSFTVYIHLGPRYYITAFDSNWICLHILVLFSQNAPWVIGNLIRQVPNTRYNCRTFDMNVDSAMWRWAQSKQPRVLPSSKCQIFVVNTSEPLRQWSYLLEPRPISIPVVRRQPGMEKVTLINSSLGLEPLFHQRIIIE